MTQLTDLEIAEARQTLINRWDSEGQCNSCGWWALLYEHDVTDADIAEALEHDNGVLHLNCVSKDADDPCSHRGVRVNIAAEKELDNT